MQSIETASLALSPSKLTTAGSRMSLVAGPHRLEVSGNEGCPVRMRSGAEFTCDT